MKAKNVRMMGEFDACSCWGTAITKYDVIAYNYAFLLAFYSFYQYQTFFRNYSERRRAYTRDQQRASDLIIEKSGCTRNSIVQL